MALVNKSFSVNVTPGAMPPIVHVSEYDVGRAYTVSILDEQGNTFTIPSGTTASIEGTLNGSVGFTQSATVSNNQVSFTLSESMTAYSGKAWCKIKLTLNSEPIQTCAFILAVDRAGVEAETVIGAPGFEEQIQQGVADYMSQHTVRAEDERLDALATFTEETGRVPLFVNQLPISTDTDGTIFYGVGYHEGYRFNSSGEEVAATGVYTTGFIPATRDSILRFSDIGMYVEEHTGVLLNYIYVCTYDSSKTFTSAVQLHKMLQNAPDCMIVVDGNATEIDFSKTVDGSYGVRTGTAFVRISAYGVSSASIITVNEEIAYNEHGEITSAALKPDVSIPQLDPLDARITALEEDEGGGTIDSTDPLVKYAKQIDNGLTVGYEPTLTNRPTADLVSKKYLNFLHISDTHGSVNAENAVKILNKLKADGRCSFLIHTGDFHSSTFADVASWNTFAGYIAQATAPVLLVSGNHDVGNNSQSTTDGTTATDAQLYARCFAPYVSGWNLTSHPTGKCYWYKDFADEGVRLIGLYDFESDYATDSNGQLLYKRGYAAYHQAQIDWLVQALLSCPSGYGVIIAKHNPMNKRGTLGNPFNGEFLQGQNTAQSYVSKDMIAEIVQAFMDGTTINKTFAQTGNVTDTLTVNQSFASKNSGAHFICYLDGHTHADGVNFLADYPKQLELNIGCDNYHYQHYADTLNQQNTLHQDLLNYVSVDVNRGYVYIQRIGNDYTAQADRRDFTAIDYKNPPVVVDFPEVDASDDGKVWGVSGGQYGLIASPTPTEPVLEEILTITGDGTRPFVTTDKNGEPFALKKMVVKAEITESLGAAGNISFHGMSGTTGTPTSLCSLYFSWSASATNKFKAEGVLWQENGFWRQTSYGFSNNGYGAINGTYAYDFALSTADYPAIRAVDSGSVVPAGITIKVYGVRA